MLLRHTVLLQVLQRNFSQGVELETTFRDVQGEKEEVCEDEVSLGSVRKRAGVDKHGFSDRRLASY